MPLPTLARKRRPPARPPAPCLAAAAAAASQKKTPGVGLEARRSNPSAPAKNFASHPLWRRMDALSMKIKRSCSARNRSCRLCGKTIYTLSGLPPKEKCFSSNLQSPGFGCRNSSYGAASSMPPPCSQITYLCV
ncbi:hypothetical protein JRQ81_016348 [Phrynocephalus forsythii]|uniref:Uncharacterized protein n=1 Tax=Phrynocephalus forsythii TaxID=171643 RepID=A0A9Q1B0I4_9SAUR|nr:hypothetical protein JRQ81_016348 [Phrynocephalus forsythii]